VDNVDVLIDPGTFTYVADPRMRDYFRGSAAHNTIRVDGLDQARPVAPFAWDGKPEVRILSFGTGLHEDSITAEWRANGVCHRRTILLDDQKLVIRDRVELPPGEHLVEQHWHLGMPAAPLDQACHKIGDLARIALRTKTVDLASVRGWRSSAYGRREESPVLRTSWRGEGVVEIETEIAPF
jgi:hypothetical protein